MRVTGLVAGVYLALRLLWVAQELVFLAFIGLLFGLALSAGADRLERRGLHRSVGAPLLLLVIFGSIGGLATVAAPSITSQLQDVQDQVPQVVGKVRGWVDAKAGGVTDLLTDTTTARPKTPGSTRTHAAAPDSAARPAGEAASDKGGGVGDLAPQIGNVGHAFFAVFSSTLTALAGLILIVFMTLFIAIDPGLYHRGLMHLFPHESRARAGEVLRSVGYTLRRWLVTQLIAMVVIGLVSAGVLMLIGVRGAGALGIIAGLLEFIPFVGPIAAAIPAMAMGLLDSPQKALYVAIAFTVIQQAEGHLLIPLLMKDSLSLPPVLTILSQALMATVFGFLGLLVAVPLLGAVMVPIKLLYVEDVVGDDVGVPGPAKAGA